MRSIEKKDPKWRARQGGEGNEPLFLMANGKRMSEKAFTPAGTVFAITPPGLLREMCSDINPMICGQRLRPFLRSALSCYPDQAANALGTVKYWMGHKKRKYDDEIHRLSSAKPDFLMQSPGSWTH